MAADELVTLGAAKRLGENLVGNAVQDIVQVLIAASSPRQLGQDWQRPAAREKSDEKIGCSPLLGGGRFRLAVQWLAGYGVSLAPVARSKMVATSRE